MKRRRVTLFAPMLAALVGAHAFAGPGTPSWVKAEALPVAVTELPDVKLTFKGWKEKVRFYVEMTRDGQRASLAAHLGVCNPVSREELAGPFACAAPMRPEWNAPGLGYFSRPGTQGYWMSFRGLEYGSEYCFRIRTQDEDGDYADLWTGWACTRTKPQPPPPSAPVISKMEAVFVRPPGATYTQETVRVFWKADGETAMFEVEVAALVPNVPFFKLSPRAQPQAREFAFLDNADSKKPVQIRVCALNVNGRACSIARRYPPRDIAENAKAVDVPDHRPQPMTSASEARKAAPIVAKPPPVTSVNAAKPIAESSPLIPPSSFNRGGGGLR